MAAPSTSSMPDATTTRIAGQSSAFGVAVSFLSIALLGFLWLRASRTKRKLRALTWAVPPGNDVGKRTLFADTMRNHEDGELDKDDTMVVRLKGGLGKDTVTLHTERSPDLARPVIILSCHDSAWEAIKASKNVETDVLVTLLVLSLGNVVAAGVAVVLWKLQISPDLLSALAGNTLLVIAPLLLLSAKLLFDAWEGWTFKKVDSRFDQIDIETVLLAIKESVEGSVRLLVPVFSMSYILTKKPATPAGGDCGEPREGEGSADAVLTLPALKAHLQKLACVQWFPLEDIKYTGFDTLYKPAAHARTEGFEAAWLGKLLEGLNDGERNRILSSVVLSYLRWTIFLADESGPGRYDNPSTNGMESKDDIEVPATTLEEARLLDGEGRPTVTFGQAYRDYFVPFVMLDTISISKAGGTLDKHWAAYQGRKQMQNQEPLLKFLLELSEKKGRIGEAEDLWALINRITPDLRSGPIETICGIKLLGAGGRVGAKTDRGPSETAPSCSGKDGVAVDIPEQPAIHGRCR